MYRLPRLLLAKSITAEEGIVTSYPVLAVSVLLLLMYNVVPEIVFVFLLPVERFLHKQNLDFLGSILLKTRQKLG